MSSMRMIVSDPHFVFMVDVGITEHPTVVTVVREGDRDAPGTAVAHIRLEGVDVEGQYRVLEALFEYYLPLRVIMDRGMGLMLFEYIREYGDRHLAQRLEPA